MVTYDEVKREANIKNHGFDFVGSDVVFAGFTITREDGRDAYVTFANAGVVAWSSGICGAYPAR